MKVTSFNERTKRALRASLILRSAGIPSSPLCSRFQRETNASVRKRVNCPNIVVQEPWFEGWKNVSIDSINPSRPERTESSCSKHFGERELTTHLAIMYATGCFFLSF